MLNAEGESLRVLHVDDDKDIRELVMIALKDVGGLEVTQFASGNETIDKSDRIDADLFLLDIMMPGLSGPETLEKLRSLPVFASIPAVFLTANPSEYGPGDPMKLGIAAIIAKPFDPMTLAEELVQIWRSSLR